MTTVYPRRKLRKFTLQRHKKSYGGKVTDMAMGTAKNNSIIY